MKWQDVRDLGINLFKKRNRSRTLWVGGSLSIFSVIAYILLLTGVSVSYTGDEHCTTECISYFNVTSTYWRICFADDFNLVQTNPDIPVDTYVPTVKRYADKIVDGKYWRLFDKSKDCIERKNAYNILPNRFMIIGHKEAHETVKWSVDKFDIDPVWIGFSIEEKCKSYDYVVDKTYYEHFYKTIEKERIDCSNKSGINTDCEKVTYEEEIWDRSEEVKIYKEVCVDKIGYDINEDTLDCEAICHEKDGIITCEEKKDSNGDGILQSGESGFTIDVTKESWKELSKKIDSRNYEDMKRCVIK